MRHARSSGHSAPRLAARRALARHRPRPPTWSRADQCRTRASDIVLALAGVVFLGAVSLYAAIALIGRAVPT